MKNSAGMGMNNSYVTSYKLINLDDDGPFAFDQVMADKEPLGSTYYKKSKQTKENIVVPEKQFGFNPKTKRDGIWNRQIKPREHPKSVFVAPVTSA